jgi:hypothetical protein
MSQELEILKTLAGFVISLISITIPTYAIAISLLGPEYTKMIERIGNEKQKLEKELQEKASGPFRLEELEVKIEEFHEKENKLKGRFNPLSLYPTVVFPNIFFGFALLVILTGLYFDAQAFLLWLILFLMFAIMGRVE